MARTGTGYNANSNSANAGLTRNYTGYNSMNRGVGRGMDRGMDRGYIGNTGYRGNTGYTGSYNHNRTGTGTDMNANRADSSVRRNATPVTTNNNQPAKNTGYRQTTAPVIRNGMTTRAAGYRNTAAEARNSTITSIVLLSAIVALLVLPIWALMRRPQHDRVTDNDYAGRRR